MHYVNVKITIIPPLFPCSNRYFTEDQIDLQFHNGESEWFSFLLRFFLFLLRRRLCSISFFLKNMNNYSSFNVTANKKNINVLHTKKYIVFNFTKYPGQVSLRSHPYLLQVLLPFRTSVVTGFTLVFHVSPPTHRVPKFPQEGLTGFRGFQVLPVDLHIKQEMFQKHLCPPWCKIQVFILCRSKTCMKQVTKGLKYINGQQTGLKRVVWPWPSNMWPENK